MGQRYVGILNDRALLSAISDTNEDRLNEFGEQYSVPTYVDPGEMIAHAEIDAVIIATPADSHAALTIAALSRLDVMVEKPLGISHDEVKTVITSYRASDRILMCAHVLRFWPPWKILREILSSDRFGRVLFARFWRYAPPPPTERQRVEGALVDLAIHCVDIVQDVWGLPTRLRAVSGTAPETGAEFYRAEMIMDDFLVALDGGWFPGRDFGHGFEVVCERATINTTGGLTIYLSDGTEERPQYEVGDPYAAEVDYFHRCVEERRHAERSPPEESAWSVGVALLLRRSSERNGLEMEVT